MHRAIAYYENALSVLTESEFPGFWANTQMNLGITWSEVSRTSQNEQKECLLRAAACYQSSMRVYTESELPQMWTRSMVFLSNVWRDIPATNPKERVQNLLRAIEINKKLLSFDDEQGLTSRWVACQMGLGDLWKMIPASDEEERRKTMESAVACYDAACSVSKELEAIDSGRWLLARAQEKLANTLCELPVKNNSERGTNLRRSVQCYQEALRMNAGSVSRYDCDRLSASIQRVRAELDILS
jgi:hypothetical protein